MSCIYFLMKKRNDLLELFILHQIQFLLLMGSIENNKMKLTVGLTY
jgi:hypothetical protein